jgi:hypothetical protein
MLLIEFKKMSVFSAYCQVDGGGPLYHPLVIAIAPPLRSSAAVTLL